MFLSAAHLSPILICAFLNLDKQVCGPFMVGRPLVVGFVVGAATGAASYGTWMGLSVELLWLAAMPLGGQLTPNAGLAVGAAVIAWVFSGFGPAVGSFQTEAGLVISFLTVPLWGRFFAVIDKFCRRQVSPQLAQIRADLLSGHEPHLFQRNLYGLWWTLGLSLVAVTGAVIINGLILDLVAWKAPEAVLQDLGYLFHFIPFLGLLGMGVSFLESKTLTFYFGGLLAGLLVLSAVK